MFNLDLFGWLTNAKHAQSEILQALDKSQATIEFKMDGTIITANKLFLDVMGYTLEEIQGKHHRMFAEPEYAQSGEYRTFWEKLGKGEFQRAEYLRLAKGGKEVWIQASYNPILNSNGKPYKVIKFATDITFQKLMSFDHAGQIDAINKSQAIIEFTTEGIILNANKNFLDTMGYTLQEIKGKHHKIFADPQYAESSAYTEFWDSLRQGEYQTAEYQRFGKNKKEVWIQASYNPILDEKNRIIKIIKFATDITKTKLLNTYYEGQIQAISKSQAVIEFETDGTIITANENFLVTMGYSLAEIQGKHHSMFVDKAFAESDEYKSFWEQLRQGKYKTAEFKRLGKGNKEVWIQASYNPILDLKGKPFKVVKFATNVSTQMNIRNDAEDRSAVTNSDIQSVSSTIQQMLISATDIGNNINNSQNAIKDIIQKNTNANELANKLQENTKAMEGIVTIIRKISEQVNLLALNATIEAARAGEAGKGFAVVAGEVKGLANETAKATDLISEEILSIQQVVDEVVNSGSTISDSTKSVGEYINTIVGSIEQQTILTNNITSKIQNISEGVEALNNCIKSISSCG